MTSALLAFAGVSALIIVTPGLDTLLVVRASAGQGRLFGLAAGLGILTGCLTWGIATAVGLTALLTASHLAYDIVRIAGAGYLTWLGISALIRSFRSTGQSSDVSADPTPSFAEPGKDATDGGRSSAGALFAAFRSGTGTNLLNPKAGVFYMSLIPQFIPHGASTFGTTMSLTAIDIAETAVWLCLVAGAAHALAERIRRPSFLRRMEQVSGVAFLGFAVNLLLGER